MLTILRKYLPESLKAPMRQLRDVGLAPLLSDRYNDLTFRLTPRTQVVREARLSNTFAACFELAGKYFSGGPTQSPREISAFLDYVKETSPEVALEIGSASGGNAFLLAQSLPSLKLLICLDLQVRNRRQLLELTRDDVKIQSITGASQREETLKSVRGLLDGRSLDLLFIDGDHSFSGVFLDFFGYRGLMSDGGVVAFHDIVPDNRLRSGQPMVGAYSGEVPVVWGRLKQYYRSCEFVDDWSQEGLGIGALRYDKEVLLRPLDIVL